MAGRSQKFDMMKNMTAEGKRTIEDFLKDTIFHLRNAYREHFDIALENYFNYNSKPAKKFYEGRSDVFVPMSFQIVETLTARAMKTILGQPLYPELDGIQRTKMETERLRILLHHQAKKNVKIYLKLQDYWRNKCIYGRAYAKMKWRKETRNITHLTAVRQPQGESEAEPIIQLNPEQKLATIYDCWDYENIDFFDMMVHPNTPDADIQRSPFTVQDKLVTYSELLTNPLFKEVTDRFDDLEDRGEGELSEKTVDRKDSLGVDVSQFRRFMNDGKLHKLQEIHLHYDLDGDGIPEANVVMYLLDEKRLIWAGYNQFWHQQVPIISSAFTRRPNEWQAMSPLDPIRRMQYEVNDKRNQILDSTTMALNLVWLVGHGAGIEENQIMVGPNEVIRVNDINQIKPLDFKPMNFLGEQQTAIMESIMRESTGATRSVQGVGEAGPRQTAVQFTQLLAQAGERLLITFDSYGHEAWTNMWTMAHSLNQQFFRTPQYISLTADEARLVKFFGAEGEIMPEEVAQQLDFMVPSFGEIEIKGIRDQQLLNFLNMMLQLPPSEDNARFFDIVVKKVWTDQFKFTIQDLTNEDGSLLELTQPGAAKEFDMANHMAQGGAFGGGGGAPQQQGSPEDDFGAPSTDLANIFRNGDQQGSTGGFQ